MAKDNRKINAGVRVGREVFTEGREDELAAALPQEELDRLLEQGALGGDWKSKAAKEEKKPAAKEEKK